MIDKITGPELVNIFAGKIIKTAISLGYGIKLKFEDGSEVIIKAESAEQRCEIKYIKKIKEVYTT